MNRLIRGVMLASITATPVAAKTIEAPIDPGPRPEITEFRAKAEQSILAGFFDPSSAQFQWDHGIAGGYFKPVLQKKFPGWWTCGLVNGRNRMGGYVGFRSFVVVMNNNQVTFSAVGDGSAYDFIAGQCQQALAKGMLPPPEPIAAPEAPEAPLEMGLASTLGFTYRNQPDGVAINEVSTGGLAAAAELAPSMVVVKVNGLSLDGLSPEMRAKLLDNAGGGAVLTVQGRGEMKMERQVTMPTPPAPAPRRRPKK